MKLLLSIAVNNHVILVGMLANGGIVKALFHCIVSENSIAPFDVRERKGRRIDLRSIKAYEICIVISIELFL
jgi:hypothetical protein